MASDKQTLFAVLEYLADLKARGSDGTATVDAESLEVAMECLGGAVGLSHDEPSQRAELSTAAFYTLPQALEAAEASMGREAKFAAFVDKLRERGAFAGREEGSAEYKEIVAKARARFESKYGAAPAAAAAKASDAPAPSPVKDLEAAARADEYKKQGNAALTSGRLDDAVELYTKAIEANPSNHVYYANRAAAYLHLGKHEKCVEDNDTSIGIAPGYVKAYLRKGKALVALGRHEEAIETFEEGGRVPGIDDRSAAAMRDGVASARGKMNPPAAAGGAGAGAGSPFGGIDLAGLMSNPQVMQMMSNPEFAGMAAQMMGGMMGGGGGGAPPAAAAPAAAEPAVEAAAEPAVARGADGLPSDVPESARGPLAELMQDPEVVELRKDPELAPVFADFEQNGAMAMMKYLGNQSVMQKLEPVIGKFTEKMGLGNLPAMYGPNRGAGGAGPSM